MEPAGIEPATSGLQSRRSTPYRCGSVSGLWLTYTVYYGFGLDAVAVRGGAQRCLVSPLLSPREASEPTITTPSTKTRSQGKSGGSILTILIAQEDPQRAA